MVGDNFQYHLFKNVSIVNELCKQRLNNNSGNIGRAKQLMIMISLKSLYLLSSDNQS